MKENVDNLTCFNQIPSLSNLFVHVYTDFCY